MSQTKKTSASGYNVVADRHCPGNWLVMKTGTDFVACSHTTYEAAEQAARILRGSDESWTNGK